MKSVTLKSVGYATVQTMLSNALEHAASKEWIVAVAVGLARVSGRIRAQ